MDGLVVPETLQQLLHHKATLVVLDHTLSQAMGLEVVEAVLEATGILLLGHIQQQTGISIEVAQEEMVLHGLLNRLIWVLDNLLMQVVVAEVGIDQVVEEPVVLENLEQHQILTQLVH